MKALTLCMRAREKLKELPKIVGVPIPRIALVKRVTTLISAPWSCWPPQDFLAGRQRKSRSSTSNGSSISSGTISIGRMHTHSNRNLMHSLRPNHVHFVCKSFEQLSPALRKQQQQQQRRSSRSSTSGSHRMRLRRRWSTVRDHRGRRKSFLCQRHQR